MDQGRAPHGDRVLETSRLLLRPQQVPDAEVFRQLWLERDPRVPPHRRITPDGRPTLEDIESQILRDDGCPSPGLLAVELRNTGQVIGYCGLISNKYGQPDEPELAYEFLRAVWGRGYATESARTVVDQARAIGYQRLWATVRDWNVASRRVLAKSGFVETGRVEPDPVHGDSLFTAKVL